jgi:hypothetical protein
LLIGSLTEKRLPAGRDGLPAGRDVSTHTSEVTTGTGRGRMGVRFGTSIPAQSNYSIHSSELFDMSARAVTIVAVPGLFSLSGVCPHCPEFVLRRTFFAVLI